jgi:hypothetical protein
MYMVMALFDSDLVDEIFLLMKLAKVENYTLFKALHGSGKQGKKEGTVAWPGTNELIMLIMDKEKLEELKKISIEYKKDKNMEAGYILTYWPLNEVII